ncbi:hypothetical protein [Methyloterricola oryzae]|uniref:hypothetical protein n=1 Tax=Methyloterricola oryzae TaxID=1495050 RepID=UPI0005EBAD0B|nr:hypothetical protein [Methyloterricola oryzae]
MSNAAGYRFLPWTRRGLAAAITAPESGGSLPARANVAVTVTVKASGGGAPDALQEYRPPEDAIGLYGPGDIIGIDPRVIVRASPRPGSSNVETNYFAAVEFDPPDFPWMFTPARADGQQRLLPWLVLLVLDRARVDPPKADRLRPLPTVKVRAEVAAQELPDLAESWAWAHAQVVVEEGSATPLADELSNRPDHNVSRILCPRRLEPNHHYIACLVPAFDVGVIRGLGGAPDPKQHPTLAPAWPTPPGAVELPVYYHWEFATGPLGDFESLARKLKPFACPETVGVTPLYIGDGNPVIPAIPPEEAEGNTLMDGALRAPKRSSGRLDEIAEAVQGGLSTALNAPARFLEGGPADATPVLGPPIYGQWHARAHAIGPGLPAWMTELNLDPRARVAAGFGAEVVRRNQEDFMQQAWEQVGEILKAQDRLNWGRLSFEANLRGYERHFSTLPGDRLLSLAAPLLGRTRAGDGTLMTRLRASSLTNAAADPALRRLTSPQRPVMKATARRLSRDGRLSAGFSGKGRSSLVDALASGRRAADPTAFTPDGLVSSVTLDRAQGQTVLDLGEQGLALRIDGARLQAYGNAAQPLRGRDFQSNPLTIEPRADLRTAGVVTRSQIDNLTELNLASDDPVAATTGLAATVKAVLDTSIRNAGAKGMLVTLNKSSAPSIDPLEIDSRGTVFVKSSAGTLTQVGSVSPDIVAGGVANLNTVLADLPVGTFSRTGAVKPAVSRSVSGELLMRDSAFDTQAVPATGLRGTASVRTVRPVPSAAAEARANPRVVERTPTMPGRTPPVVVRPPATQPPPAAPPMPSNTLPMPVTAVEAVAKYDATIRQIIAERDLNRPVERGRFVAFDIAASRDTLLARLDPKTVVPRRLLEMVKIQGGLITAAVDRGLRVTPWFDRIMAAPELPVPTYQYLAGYDRERFVPGIGVIPPNSITLLETNPRFIEAFMVGVNYEMNRELLWRAYPTDQRGTPFRHFWQWLDGQPDIDPIHTWFRGGALGSHTRGAGTGGQIVLLIRGDLIRRYPNAVLLAWKATADGQRLTEQPAIVKAPAFWGKLDPDIIFGGFDLVDEDLIRDGGWFFLVQEQPTEPRFGFDQPDGAAKPLARWADASWSHTGVAEGGYLRLAASPLNHRALAGLEFGRNAAHIASICLQQPMRVAVHGRHLVK